MNLQIKTHKKFTLLELLVVIAIIGILSSILLPILGKARKKSQSVVCKNQLKQIYHVAMMYAEDNDEQFYIGDWGNAADTSTRWISKIKSYYNRPNNDIFQCATFQSAYPGVSFGTQSGFGYTLNNDLDDDGTVDSNSSTAIKWRSLSSIPSPSEASSWIDGVQFNTNNYPYITAKYNLDPAKVGNYHQGGANVVYIDGHIVTEYRR